MTARAPRLQRLALTGLLSAGCVAITEDDLPNKPGCDDGLPPTVWYEDLDSDGYGSAATRTACTQPAGYTTQSGDCDDLNALKNPAALELCDGQDHNCNGIIGTESAPYLRDADGDGFGGNYATTIACEASLGWSSLGYDCNDQDASIHPMLVSINGIPLGDGTPQQPFSSIQAAVDNLRGCPRVLVEPGLYPESVEVEGLQSGMLASTGTAADTILETTDGSRPLTLTGLVTFTLKGFQLRAQSAVSGLGGGLLISAASDVTVSDLVVNDARVATGEEGGGALAVVDSSRVVISDATLQRNQAALGGALFVHNSSVTVNDSLIGDNSASESGGGVYVSGPQPSSILQLQRCSLTSNFADYRGGGGYADEGAQLEVLSSTLSTNSTSASYGGGLYNPSKVFQSRFFENTATGDSFYGDGGALYLQQTVTVSQSLFVGNQAYFGGALVTHQFDSNQQFTLLHNTFVDNDALTLAESIYFYSAVQVTMANNIVAHFGVDESLGSVAVYNWDLNTGLQWTIEGNDVYHEDGSSFGGAADLDDATWKYGNVIANPRFLVYSPDQFTSTSDLHLASDSPCINAGDSDYGLDVDGSLPDMGAYGGPYPLP